MKKYLLINLGEKGGCVYYANSIIRNMHLSNKEVWLNPDSEGGETIPHKAIFLASLRLRQFIFLAPFAFIWYFILLSVRILCHRYRGVVVFGPHIMDFIFLTPFRVWGKRAIYVVHDGIMHNGDAPKAYQIEIKWCLKIANEFIYLSDFTKCLVADKLGISKPSLIIPHGLVTYCDVTLENRENRHPNKFLLIGRITYYKGVDIVFKFLENFKDFKGSITIAGKFSSDINIPENIHNDKRLTVIDKWLSATEMDTLIKSADVMLMPYYEATQSGVAAMALGYGIPVIATRVGALEEQLGNSAVYMNSIDEVSLNDCINQISSEESYTSKCMASLEIREKLSWESLAQSLETYLSK